MKKYRICEIEFEVEDEWDAKKRLLELLAHGYGHTVFTPNASILERASSDRRLALLLGKAELLLPDGVGIALACKMSGCGSVRRVTGIDTAQWLLRIAAARGLSVFFLGGKPQVAQLAADRLKQRLPALKLCGTQHGYFDKSPSSAENRAVIKRIRQASPDILFVCMGFPLQEAWIQRYKKQLPSVRLLIGLGGSFDVWAGVSRRAPSAFQSLGLEWLWRCMSEPKRLCTLWRLPVFMVKALTFSLAKEKVSNKKPTFLLKKKSRQKKIKQVFQYSQS